MSIKVLIADDHEVVRRGMASLLAESEVEIVAEAAGGEEAVEQARKHLPDVALMDIRMAGGDGLNALEAIRAELPKIKVVMLSTYDNPTYMARAVALGACDYVLKGSGRDEILSSIRAAADGTAPAPNSRLHKIVSTMSARQAVGDGPVRLTRRETQVLRHVALGLSNKEIGRSLGISIETVKEHVQNILRKVKLNDRTQAAVWAIRQGLVD